MMLKNYTRLAALAFTLFQIAACGSTANEEAPQDCRMQNEDVCDDTAQDRGYDPCLVNDKLPICQTK